MAKCKLIVCDGNTPLNGIAVEHTGKSGQCTVNAFDVMTDKGNGSAAIVAVVAFSHYACFELMLPQAGYSELTDLLKFELPRRLPYPAAELTVFFRKFPVEAGKCRVRVFAVKSSEWRGGMEKLQGCKVDAAFHPFMAMPVELESPVYLPEFEPDYIWNKDGGIWAMDLKPDKPVEPVCNLPELLVDYVLSPDFQRDRKYLSALPRGLQIQRYKYWKISIVILAAFTAAAALVYGYQHVIDRRNLTTALQREAGEAVYRLEYLTAALEQSRSVSETAQKILDGLSEIEPLPVMALLTRSLPDSAWITGFRTGNGELALTLSVSGNTEPVNTALNQLPFLAVDSLRQQANPDGSATLYVTLKQAGGVE